MEENEVLFMEALRASLKNEQVIWEKELTADVWLYLFQTAEKHHVLPMIYEAVYNCEAAKMTEQSVFTLFKQRTVQTVMLQTMKTSEFLQLYSYLNSHGIFPIVVKGIICRNLYPNPDYRISGDEDILVSEDQFSKCHDSMLEYGMESANPDLDFAQADEVPYGKKGSPLYIEAHKFLFPPDSDAYGDMNSYFCNIEKQSIELLVDGIKIRTMGYTDHLFYLICHAMKHWLHSGVGVRQVCDIIMMANSHGAEIEWERIIKQCREIRAEQFAIAIFRIGEKYLTFNPEIAHYPEEWYNNQVDEKPLLQDMLSGGVYGAVDMERQHSSTVTLNAVAAQKQGKKGKANILRSIFPGVKALKGRYPYLEDKPFLLPIAWLDRIWKYKSELKSGRENSATKSIQIGEQRIKLLKQYGVLNPDEGD